MNGGTMSGNVREIMTELRIHPIVSGSGLRVGYVNWGVGDRSHNPFDVLSRWYGLDKYPGWQEARTSKGRVAIQAAVCLPNGNWRRLTFAGQTEGIVNDGGQIFSDWDPITVSAGAELKFRFRIAAADSSTRILTGGSYHYDFTNRATAIGPGLPDILTPAFFGNVLAYENGALVGDPYYVNPTVFQTRTSDASIHPVLAIGDSILRAGGDVGAAANLAGFVNPGWVGRGFRSLNIPVVALGVAGDRAELCTSVTMSRRAALIRELGVDTALIQHGINDAASKSEFSDSRPTAGEMLARNRTLADYLRTLGLKRVILSTLLPNTTSPDGWTSVDQKIKTNGYVTANWVSYNSSLRRGVEGFEGIVDPASYVSDAEFRWRTAATSRIDFTGVSRSDLVTMRFRQIEATQGYFLGSVIKFLGGRLDQQFRFITNSYAHVDGIRLKVETPFSSAPRHGTRFQITPTLTRDGTHPTPLGNHLAAEAIKDQPSLWRY
jgi:lysophospholipase L1-like esterase